MRGLLQYRLSWVLAGIAVGLTVLSAILNGAVELVTSPSDALRTFESHFDAVAEHTVQSWFSSVLLAAGATLACVVTIRRRRASDGVWRRWLVVSIALWWVSLDETVGLHELLNDADAKAGAGRFAWIAVGIPVVIVLTVLMLPIFKRLQRRVTITLVLAGVTYVGGAIGVEFVSGFFVGTDLVYGMIAHAEELLEMLGAVLFIEGMLRLNGVAVSPDGRISLPVMPQAPRLTTAPPSG